MSSQPITIDRQRELMERLEQLAARRGTDAAEIERHHEARAGDALAHYEEQRERAIAQFENQHAALIREFKSARETALAQYESAGYTLAAEEERFYAEANQALAEGLANAKTLRQHRVRETL